MERYAFWNNKGGTGKTTLAFQTICAYANKYSDKRVLVIDMCPQANLSELLLGGLSHNGSQQLLAQQKFEPRATIGGYFQLRLPSPYSPPDFNPTDFICSPSIFNHNIPKNLSLVCGDPILELQSNAISTQANARIPGTNAWLNIIDWLNIFIEKLDKDFDIVFFDTNPSFSIYTQVALASTSKLFLPVMADDSSRRAVQNAIALIYGIELPSEIYTNHTFAHQLKEGNRDLPQICMVIKNRITQYMGSTSAYRVALSTIESEVKELHGKYPQIFIPQFNSTGNHNIVEIADFQTTGVVAAALGSPLYRLTAGKIQLVEDIEKKTQITIDNIQKCSDNINLIVKNIN